MLSENNDELKEDKYTFPMDNILPLIARLNLIGTSDMKSTPPAIAVSIIPACIKPATEMKKKYLIQRKLI